MPRTGRLHIAGGYYHVMGRGLERRRIFSTKNDKEDFLERFAFLLKEMQYQCMAWALMTNHYHLLIRVGSKPLSHLMQRLLSGYATNYNIRHRRTGYVFQNRYKSILCDADLYFLELVRYIHLNPLKSKILKDIGELDTYPWTGHAAIMRKLSNNWQNTDEVLSHFSVQSTAARRQYRMYVADGAKTNKNDYSGGGLIRSYGGWQELTKMRKNHEARIGDERILGESEFVLQVLKEDDLNLEEEISLKNKGWNLDRLVNDVCLYFAIDSNQITARGRDNSVSYAKAVICYWGNLRLGLSSTDLGIRLRLSQSGVSRAVKRGRKYCEENDLDMEIH